MEVHFRVLEDSVPVHTAVACEQVVINLAKLYSLS